jgi:hypothetical protein
MTAIVAVPGSEAGCCIATVPLSAAVALNQPEAFA